MDLQYVQNLLVGQARQAMALLATDAPIEINARTLRELSRLFQGIAICRLLVSADTGKFVENLTRSGHARRYFLQRSRIEGSMSDRFLGLSRSDAIFDAIVAGDAGLVRDIVGLSLEAWDPGRDYEDDYCYYLIVHRIATLDEFRADPECAKLLDRFARALEGKSSPRLELCLAYQRDDGPALRAALESFLAERRDRLAQARGGITEYTAQAVFWPQSFVCIEALAWLALAGARPELNDDFLYCPPEARRVWRASAVPPPIEDFFQSLQRALEYGAA